MVWSLPRPKPPLPIGPRGFPGPEGTEGPPGPQGNPGHNGNPGQRGSEWTSGEGNPSPPADAGDMYLDTLTYNVWQYGPPWAQIGNIKGPQGVPGITGIQRARVLTDGSGAAVWTFPTPFVSPPRITCSVENSGTLPYLWNISALSNTQVTVQLWQAQLLPAVLLLLANLVNYNVFGGTTLTDIPVHIWAVEQ